MNCAPKRIQYSLVAEKREIRNERNQDPEKKLMLCLGSDTAAMSHLAAEKIVMDLQFFCKTRRN